MKKILSLFTVICAWHAGSYAANNAAKMSEQEALQIATEAYIYAYPLVTMDMTKRVMTNVIKPETVGAPINQFANVFTYPDASFRDVTTPNADTLYSYAWLDLSKGPYVLHVPNLNGRYYLMPILSAWTNVFFSPGSRTTGEKEHDFVIVGPNSKVKIPAHLTEIKSPTNMAWIIGRTYCNGTPADYATANAIQREYKLIPLSSYGKPYTPPGGTVNPDIDMQTPVRNQVNAMDGKKYFKYFAKLLQENPPAKADAPMLAKLKKIGIEAGHNFDLNAQDPTVIKALDDAVKAGQQKILAEVNNKGLDRNGWKFALKMGVYGTDYLTRAAVATMGLGANLPQDAIYPFTTRDSTGQKLNGAHRYVIHMSKDQMPPVDGFWSLTMYDSSYFFVPNSLSRYTLSPRNNLKFNKDGSLNLYIQHNSPGQAEESNWLPAPKDDFILMLRFYWPKKAIIDGSWMPPKVKEI